MTRALRCGILVCLIGCGGGGGGEPQVDARQPEPDGRVIVDGRMDVLVDAPAQDAAPDVTPDGGSDMADSGPRDLSPDLAADAAADLAPDVALDGTPDSAPDLTPDLTADLTVDTRPSTTCGTGARTEPPIAGPSAAMTDSDQAFRSLTVDPKDPEVVFMGSEGNGIFRSLDGGKTWQWLRTGLRYDGFGWYAETWDLAIAPSKTDVIYAATTDSPGPPSGPYPSAIAGIYRSDDRGLTWRQVGCNLPNSKAASLYVDPSDHQKVVAAFDGGEVSFMPKPPMDFYGAGIFRSADAGVTWTMSQAPAGTDRNGFWRILRRGNALYTVGVGQHGMASASLGILKSADDGATWTALKASLSGMVVPGWDLTSDGMTILATPRDMFQLRRSTDGGETFHQVTTFPVGPNGPLAIAPDGSAALIAGNKDLYRSTLALNAADKVLAAEDMIEEIVFAPSNPQIVYVSVRGLRVHRSDDGGKTFRALVNLRRDVISK